MSNEEDTKPNEYPKWVNHPTLSRGETKDGKPNPERVLVKDAKEEAEVTGKKKGKAGWADPAANTANQTGQTS